MSLRQPGGSINQMESIMRVKQFVRMLSATATAIVVAGAISVPAHAGLVVLDAWQLDTNGNVTTNIGRLNLVSGSATVYQQIDSGGNVFVGSNFVESGAIYSLSYTPNSVVGPLDVGSPQLFSDQLTISFSNVTGTVDALSGAGFHFVFTGGNYDIKSASGATATGSIVGLDGSSGSSSTATGATGATTLLANILSTSGLFNFMDSTGASLLPELANGSVLFEATTNNQITGAQSIGACPFDATATCALVNAASAGDAYLVRNIPEPGTLAIFGLALGLLGFVGRRRKQT